MLLEMVKVNEDVISLVADQIKRSFGSTEDEILSKLKEQVPEIIALDKILEKLKAIHEEVKRGKLDLLYTYLLSLFTAIQEVPDVSEDPDVVIELVSKSEPVTDPLRVVSYTGKRAYAVEAKLSSLKSKIEDLSKKLRDITVTSRDATKIYTEVLSSRVLKDKFASLLAYTAYLYLRGTNYELGNHLNIPAHIDIHIVKVLLRLGILELDKNILARYVGAGRYIARIIPIYAKLAPDEPYKTPWDVLRRKSLDATKKLSEQLNITQTLLSILLSDIGRKNCLFNDDQSATTDTCPIKGLKTCPLATACKTYAGLTTIKIFSRRQARILLRYFEIPTRKVEEKECELLMI